MRAGLRNPVRVVISEQVDSHSPTRGPPGGLRTPAALQNFYAVSKSVDYVSCLSMWTLFKTRNSLRGWPGIRH